MKHFHPHIAPMAAVLWLLHHFEDFLSRHAAHALADVILARIIEAIMLAAAHAKTLF